MRNNRGHRRRGRTRRYAGAVGLRWRWQGGCRHLARQHRCVDHPQVVHQQHLLHLCRLGRTWRSDRQVNEAAVRETRPPGRSSEVSFSYLLAADHQMTNPAARLRCLPRDSFLMNAALGWAKPVADRWDLSGTGDRLPSRHSQRLSSRVRPAVRGSASLRRNPLFPKLSGIWRKRPRSTGTEVSVGCRAADVDQEIVVGTRRSRA